MRIIAATSILAAALVVTSTALARTSRHERASWTTEERSTLRSLSLASLPPLPADPSNRYADDSAAARLGHQLFFDTRLSGNGRVSCASCHVPAQNFQDGRPLGVGVGTAGRRTMPIAGTAYSPWLFWDGRADSQWGQALGPLESAAEHGGDRAQYAHVIQAEYRDAYAAVFGRVPDVRDLPHHAGPVSDSARARAWEHIPPARQEDVSRVYANIGKAIAAYERRIQFAPARFDRYVEAELSGRPHTPETDFSDDERAGLRLFIGKANCSTCHTGALFTDNHFHNTGVPQSAAGAPSDSGRTVGVRNAIAGEFNCLGRFSDAKAEDCGELRFAATDGPELVRAYKTPSLRSVTERAPYMHGGQVTSIGAVLAHYNRAPAAPAGKSELKRLRLSETELRQLEAFLTTLMSPASAPAGFLSAPIAGSVLTPAVPAGYLRPIP